MAFSMKKQHKRYTNSTLSAPLCMLVVLLTSSASSAGVHKAEVEGTSRSHQCACQLRWETRSRHTLTEASTKLITAHQAHHCDDHADARSQNRDKVSLPRSTVKRKKVT
jgi:hypothetical protein